MQMSDLNKLKTLFGQIHLLKIKLLNANAGSPFKVEASAKFNEQYPDAHILGDIHQTPQGSFPPPQSGLYHQQILILKLVLRDIRVIIEHKDYTKYWRSANPDIQFLDTLNEDGIAALKRTFELLMDMYHNPYRQYAPSAYQGDLLSAPHEPSFFQSEKTTLPQNIVQHVRELVYETYLSVVYEVEPTTTVKPQ